MLVEGSGQGLLNKLPIDVYPDLYCERLQALLSCSVAGM